MTVRTNKSDAKRNWVLCSTFLGSFTSEFRTRYCSHQKRGRTCVRPLPPQISPQRLEEQLQAQLNCAAASRPDDGVGGRPVGCDTATAEPEAYGRIVVAVAILSSVRIGKVGMIKNIEKLGSKLGAEPFPEFPGLGHRKIPVAKAGVGEQVAAHGSEGSECGRNHYRVALHEAAERIE